jgi:hypothetical protein
MIVKSLPRAVAALGATVISASGVLAQGASRGRLAGIAYTIHVASTPHVGSSAGAKAGGAQNYLGRAVFAANRGRMDIVDGGVESLFSKGDYILFDSTDLVIVHPASKVFIQLPHDVAGQTMQQLEAIGAKISIGNEKVALDSLGHGDTVSGIPTSHYRMTTAFTMSVDAGIVQQRLATESITDYWVASVSGLPRNPLLRANGLAGASAMTGMFKSISLKVDSAAKRMGSAVALRTTTVSRLIDGQGTNTMTEQSFDVSSIEPRDIDDSVLVLPADYKQRSSSGVDEAVSNDAGAKWRIPPRGHPIRIDRRPSESQWVRHRRTP